MYIEHIFICRNYEIGEEDGFEYEDELLVSPTIGMYKASTVDGVRLYPYIIDYGYIPPSKRYISLGLDTEF